MVDKELEKYILELRAQGESYQSIADAVENKFHVKRTRQAMYDICHRKSSKVLSDELKEDIVQVFVRTGNLGETKKKLKELSKQGLSDYSGNNRSSIESEFIKQNMEYVMSVTNSMKSMILETLFDNTVAEEDKQAKKLQRALDYKGVKPSTAMIIEYIEDACVEHASKALEEAIAVYYNSDKDTYSSMMKSKASARDTIVKRVLEKIEQ